MEIIRTIKNKQARLSLSDHACKSSSVQKRHELPPQAAHAEGLGCPRLKMSPGTYSRAGAGGRWRGNGIPERLLICSGKGLLIEKMMAWQVL